jgi:hypothetical protein
LEVFLAHPRWPVWVCFVPYGNQNATKAAVFGTKVRDCGSNPPPRGMIPPNCGYRRPKICTSKLTARGPLVPAAIGAERSCLFLCLADKRT